MMDLSIHIPWWYKYYIVWDHVHDLGRDHAELALIDYTWWLRWPSKSSKIEMLCIEPVGALASYLGACRCPDDEIIVWNVHIDFINDFWNICVSKGLKMEWFI